MSDLKRCSRGDNCVYTAGCWQPATTEYFYRNKTKEDGLSNECKSCVAKRYQDKKTNPNYRTHLKKRAARQRKRYSINSEYHERRKRRSRRYYHELEKDTTEDPNKMRRCSSGVDCVSKHGCNQPSTLEFFHRQKNGSDGLSAKCKACVNAKKRRQYEEKP